MQCAVTDVKEALKKWHLRSLKVDTQIYSQQWAADWERPLVNFSIFVNSFSLKLEKDVKKKEQNAEKKDTWGEKIVLCNLQS